MIKKGTEVKWKWGNGFATGIVEEIFYEEVQRNISGTNISREASNEKPAYLIKQEDGQEVLKSSAEVSRN